MFGGKVLANFFWNRPMAWTYCLPRKISSSSFSRCVVCFQTGMTTVIMTAMMASDTSSAAMA